MAKRSFLTLALLLLSACATPPNVQTTLDPEADPGKYRTFTFVQGDPKQPGAITDNRVQRRLEQMVAGRLVGKGYTQAGTGREAELGVNVTGHVEPKQRVFVTGRPGPYDYNWGRAELGGYETVDYRQGTLFVDIVDLAHGRLMWRARISEALTMGYSEENWQKVDRALAEAFKTLPPRR
jgi:hypothetical protein